MAYGVSNSFKKGVTRTYSSQKKRVFEENEQDVDIPRKRIRMDKAGMIVEEIINARGPRSTTISPRRSDALRSSSTAPSSPRHGDSTLFSSDGPEASADISLPSSPPQPYEVPPVPGSLDYPSLLHRRPTFSFLKRKYQKPHRTDTPILIAPEPLGDITNTANKSVQNTRRQQTLQKRPQPTKQMQIDLGGEVHRSCTVCGMDYIPSNEEDAALHKKFHALNAHGVALGKAFLRNAQSAKVTDLGPESEGKLLEDDEAVYKIDRFSSLSLKNKAMKVLQFVNTELGAADIENQHLWGDGSRSSLPQRVQSSLFHRGMAIVYEKGDVFQIYLYLKDHQCIGLCLAEKISNAYKVVGSNEVTASHQSSSISTCTVPDAAMLGISRIWTSGSHRRKGIAQRLLEVARRNFFKDIEVPKNTIAFSQPTESGARLAQNWFGSNIGWRVYAEIVEFTDL